MKLTKLLRRGLPLLLALPVLLTAVTSCGDSDVPDGMKSVSPASVSFELFVPTSWADNSQSGTASAFYSATDKSNVSMTCMVMDTDMTTLPEYAVYVDKSLKEALPGYALVVGSDSIAANEVDSGAVASSATEESELPEGFTATKFCGLNAMQFEYTARMEGKDYRFLQVVTAKGTYFYILTYTAEAENYAGHLEDVELIAENVRFK